MQNITDLQSEMLVEFTDFKLVRKFDSTFMQFINIVLFALSLGFFKEFTSSYTTTIGHTVYTCNGWDQMSDISRIIVLRHERIHMRQQKRYGRLLYSIIYLIPIFPVFFALGRAYLEKEAYTESIRAEIEYRGTSRVWSQEYQTGLCNQFTGPSYLWMWCFPGHIKNWVKSTVNNCVDEYVGYQFQKGQ